MLIDEWRLKCIRVYCGAQSQLGSGQVKFNWLQRYHMYYVQLCICWS